jgi:hypothetical protein
MKSKILLSFFCLGSALVFGQGATLPYYTGFDNAAQQAGWQQFRTGTLSLYDWSIGATGFSAPNQLAHDYNVGGQNTDTVIDWYVSPPLNITAPATISLKVTTSGFSTPFPDNCEVWFGTGNKNPALGNFVLIGNLSYMLPQFQWLDTLFDIPYVSDSGYIAFKYKTIGAYWSTYGIDNVLVNIPLGSFVENQDGGMNMSVSPNPFSTCATLTTNNEMKNALLVMYDAEGREVKRIENLSGHEIILDRGCLAAGLYYYRLSQDSKITSTGKIAAQ